MLRAIAALMLTALLGASAAWSQDGAAETVTVQGSRIVREDFYHYDLDGFAFTPLEQIPGRDVVRASLNHGEWGPWIAVSLERTPRGETFLSTSAVVDPPLWRPGPREGRAVVRTAMLDDATARRVFAAVHSLIETTAEPPPGRRDCPDRRLEVRMAGQAAMTLRCDEDGVRPITRELFRAAVALQPDCAPLARRVDATNLAFCHKISGDIRAGAEAAQAGRRLAVYAFDPSARRRESLVEPDVRVSWLGERDIRSDGALMRLLAEVDRDHVHTWDHVEEQIVASSRDRVLIRGFLARIRKSGGRRLFAPFEQTWVRDRSHGWRLRSWTVEPFRECPSGTRTC